MRPLSQRLRCAHKTKEEEEGGANGANDQLSRCSLNILAEGRQHAATMAHRAVIYLLFCAFGVFHKGVGVLIETEQTVVASVGKEAFLNCQLMQSKDVLQVTWQKLSPKGEDNVATCNKYFGQRVNAGFQGKVAFEAAGLQNSSIVIRNVAEQDEGCYLCMFNTYPEGAFTAKTCLKLYELHGPVLHVGRSNSTGEATVTCSATSRPAPTVTLSVLQQDLDFSNYSSVSVTNPNGTVTVTKTAVLSGFHDSNTQVGCAVQVLSVSPVTVFKMIPQVKRLSDDGVSEKFRSRENDTNFSLVIACVSVAVVLCSVALIIAVLRVLKQKKRLSNRDLEEIKTPQRKVEQPHEVKTPLLQEAENLRYRTSTQKKKKRDNQRVSSPIVKCLFSEHLSDAE